MECFIASIHEAKHVFKNRSQSTILLVVAHLGQPAG
jgi:hypothetical protein